VFSSFMMNTWIAATAVAVIAGVMGFFAVLRGSTFAAHAIPNGAFAGAAGASLLGLNAIVGLAVFSVAGAFGIAGLSRRSRPDVATALTFVLMLGVGALFVSWSTEYAQEAYSLLFGETYGVSASQVTPILVLGVVSIAAILVMFRPLMLSSAMPEVAAARGVSPQRLELAFLLVMALATSMTVPVVGALLMFSLMIGPAAAARSLTASPVVALALSVGLALITVWIGLALAYQTNWPLGFFVGIIGAALFLLAQAWSAARAARSVRSRYSLWEWFSFSVGGAVKIAFVGKGGSGKTTLSALFARYLAGSGAPVVAVDADINQHLAVALGLAEDEAAALPALGARLAEIKEYLRGENPLITSAATMVKTTPPGRGSRLLRPLGDDPLHAGLGRDVDGVRLMVTGPFAAEDLGVSCYHAKVGAVELYLNHLVDRPGEYVVVDMTAGADSFASGLFTRFDLTFLVAEPTRRGVSVWRQYRDHAAGYDVPLAVVGNKIASPDDAAYLHDQIGDDLIGCFGQSGFVRGQERGGPRALVGLEPDNLALLAALRARVDARVKDWPAYQRTAVEFHLRNAAAWASRAVGEDLSVQVDPEFVLALLCPPC
jgi:CO dehydrogenase maturation factor